MAVAKVGFRGRGNLDWTHGTHGEGAVMVGGNHSEDAPGQDPRGWRGHQAP